MKIRDFITEDADTDVTFSKIADKLYHQLYRYLYDKQNDPDFELSSVHYQDEELPCVRVSDFVRGGAFYDAIISFDHASSIEGAGGVTPFSSPQQGIQYIIRIPVYGSSVKAIVSSLTNSKVVNVFRHEMIHVLDFKRRKKPMPKIGGSNTPEKGNDTQYVEYFNSPEELNTFFHNIAEPLLNRQRHLRDEDGLATIGLFPDLPDTFPEYLSAMTKQLTGAYRAFWKYLTPENKRKITARLYRLYQDFQQNLNAEPSTEK